MSNLCVVGGLGIETPLLPTAEWRENFLYAYDKGDIPTLHSLRRLIYEETLDVVARGKYTIDNIEVTLNDTPAMMKHSCLYTDPGHVDVPEQEKPTIIEVINSDSLLAGKRLLDEGLNPVVLNFANRHTPGGGVLGGSGAQEENIFRRSNIAYSLYQYHVNANIIGIDRFTNGYPMDRNTGGAYSPNVTVFRGLEFEGYPFLKEPYTFGIVTVAAINRPALKDRNHIIDSLVEPTLKKMRTIFRIALKHNHDSIVLGAWGCGAFANPPYHIATLFKKVLREPEFVNRFKKVVFAIIDRKKIEIRNGRAGNLAIFKEVFLNEDNVIEEQEFYNCPQPLSPTMPVIKAQGFWNRVFRGRIFRGLGRRRG